MMKNVLGLDIGSHTIKAVELRQTLRGLEPVQLRVHPRIDAEAPLDETLRRFLRMHQLPTEHVVCAIPADRISSRRLKFPFRDRKKLAAAVPFEVESETPFDLDDVVVDWEPVGGERGQAVVTAAIAQRKDVAQMLEGVRGAGFEIRMLEAEGLVLANLTSIFELTGPRLLADIGHTKTTFCLLVDGRPVSMRTIPVGGLQLTEAIAKDRDWRYDDAEHSKVEDGIFHLGFQSSSPTALGVLDRIARETLRTLGSLETVLGASAPAAEITIFGGTARLHRLDEYLSERTGVRVSRLALPPGSGGAAFVAGGDPVLFAPAIALALRGTAQAQTRISFRQQEFAYRTDLSKMFGRDLRHTAVLGGLLMLVLVASMATSMWLESRRAESIESQIATLYSEAFPGEPIPSSPLAAMRSAVEEARKRADFLGVYGGNRSALDLLTELSLRVPDDLDVTFEEVAIERQTIRIKVYAESFEAADRLKNELAASLPFTSARVATEISTDRKRGGKTFGLNISLDGPGEEG